MADCPVRSHCPVNFWLELFGDRWSLLILRDIIFKGKYTFKDFSAAGEAIATNILTDRLKRLEEIGVITRHREKGRKEVRYLVTPKGADLIPAIIEIVLWSSKHDPQTATDWGFVKQARLNRKRLIAGIVKNLNTERRDKK